MSGPQQRPEKSVGRRGAWLSGIAIALLTVASCADTAGDADQAEPVPTLTASSIRETPTSTPLANAEDDVAETEPERESAEADGLMVEAGPVRDLLEGQEIEFTLVTDLVDFLGVAICVEEHIDHGPAACDFRTLEGPIGEGTTVLEVRRFLTVQNATFDCAVERCVLGVGSADGSARVTVPLHFAGIETPPEPVLEFLQPERVIADISEGLGFRELVEVAITGPFDTHAPTVAQCVVDDFLQPTTVLSSPGVTYELCWNEIGWNGPEDAVVPLREIEQVAISTILTSGWSATEVGPVEPVDCRIQACELVVTDGLGEVDRILLDFDADTLWPGWQSGTASPAEYRDGDTVRIAVTGIRPNLTHSISQCVRPDRYAMSCVPVAGATIETDAAGSGAVDVKPAVSIDGYSCDTQCWFYVFDPGMPRDVWQTRLMVDIDFRSD